MEWNITTADGLWTCSSTRGASPYPHNRFAQGSGYSAAVKSYSAQSHHRLTGWSTWRRIGNWKASWKTTLSWQRLNWTKSPGVGIEILGAAGSWVKIPTSNFTHYLLLCSGFCSFKILMHLELSYNNCKICRWENSVSSWLRTGRVELDSRQGQGFFSMPPLPDRL